MKFKTTIIAALAIISAVIIYSCDTRTYDEIGGGAVAHPTYEKDIKPIMDNYCVSCHNANGPSPDLTNYTDVKNSAESVYSEILSGDMPQGGTKLNNNTIQTFQNWINDGAPEK